MVSKVYYMDARSHSLQTGLVPKMLTVFDAADFGEMVKPGDTVAIKLHRGTWHAGPFFEDDEISFLNLELSDTNELDHHSSHLDQRFGFALRFRT